MQLSINEWDLLWSEIQQRREQYRLLSWPYPPTRCSWCGVQGVHNFYKDRIKVVTYRCRMCGHEHYNDIIYIKGSDPKVGGFKI